MRGVRVREVVPATGNADDGVRVVHVVTDDESAAACPVCGVLSSSVRQRRTTRPRDVPYGEQLLVVRWHKVQFVCRERDCARKAYRANRRGPRRCASQRTAAPARRQGGR